MKEINPRPEDDILKIQQLQSALLLPEATPGTAYSGMHAKVKGQPFGFI